MAAARIYDLTYDCHFFPSVTLSSRSLSLTFEIAWHTAAAVGENSSGSGEVNGARAMCRSNEPAAAEVS